MSKNRYINTKFWSDGFIVNLTPLERYFFLYLLTNEHTNIAGIYELPIRVMEFETSLKASDIKKILKKLIGKAYHIDDLWIYLVNFEKHQRVRGNRKVEIGIEIIKKAIPSQILKAIDSLSIDYVYTSNNTDIDSDSDSDLDIDIDRDREKKKSRFAPPSLNELNNYIKENNYQIDGENFIDFYSSKGWMVGKNKMKDWKACVRTWARRDKKDNKRNIIKL
jgi:hypothetical protein